MSRKIKKRHVDYSCGFPVVLLNVPLVRVLGEWVVDINYDAVARAVLMMLSKKAPALTGNEIRFIRTYFDMTLREFAERFGVKHTAIVKWENTKDHPANITWGTEKDIRLFILDRLCRSNKDFRESYKALEKGVTGVATGKIHALKLEMHDGLLAIAV